MGTIIARKYDKAVAHMQKKINILIAHKISVYRPGFISWAEMSSRHVESLAYLSKRNNKRWNFSVSLNLHSIGKQVAHGIIR